MRRSVVALSALMSLFAAALVEAQTVQIPDANLKQAIQDTLEITSDPSTSDMLRLTALQETGQGIANLTGLETATNLEILYIGGNQISDIGPLAGLTKLTVLYLHSNAIQDVSAVRHMTALTYLELGRNQVADISSLSGLRNLTYLGLGINQISDLSPLAGLTKLATLYVYQNQIDDDDMGVLSGLTQLQKLEFSGHQITDISPIAGLTKLVWINMRGNQISDISPLASMAGLKTLRAHTNQISDISPLGGLKGLTEVVLLDNQIADVSPLAGHATLATLDLRGNPLNAEAYSQYIPMICQNNPLTGSEFATGGSTIPGGLSYDEPLWRTLAVAGDEGGSVLVPGEGTFQINSGTPLTLEAVPMDGRYEFLAWIGTAVDGGKVEDPNAAFTKVLVDANETLQALFIERTDPNALVSLGSLGMNDTQQFNCRAVTDNGPGKMLVQRVTGIAPDLTGMMRLQMIDGASGHVKIYFGRCNARYVRLRFKYLFEDGGADLWARFEDFPGLLPGSPGMGMEVPGGHVRLVEPSNPFGGGGRRPGQVGSGQFAAFEKWFNLWDYSQTLDPENGIWVTFGLALPPFIATTEGWDAFDASVLIDDVAIEVYGDGSQPAPAPPVQHITEDFENGFNALGWDYWSWPQWRISPSVRHGGSHSAQAGEISDDEQTSLSITLDCQAGEIRFWRKVSSESNFDFLEFFIDGQSKGKWSGEQDWQKVAFPVQEGRRTFTWTYSKDSSSASGQDTAWIDEITFPAP